MADTGNVHDRFFRASMQNEFIAQAFFQHHLPEPLRDALDLASFRLENSSYIDDTLQETISDLVFTCRYNQDEGAGEAKVVLLVEHQSTPQQFMAFRVYHYMFSMLHGLLKRRPKAQAKDKLPAVYALVYYHGKQTPYPFSMRLADCFNDPLGFMKHMFDSPVPLIDVNQILDNELEQQQLLGIMTGTIKYIRNRDVGRKLVQLIKNLDSMDLSSHLKLEFINRAFIYVFNAGNIADVEQLIKDGRGLPEPVRGEFMTAAEQLQAIGEEKGLKKGREEGREEGREKGKEEGKEEGREEVAINSLKEGVDPQFVARITGLELAAILKLKAQLEGKA